MYCISANNGDDKLAFRRNHDDESLPTRNNENMAGSEYKNGPIKPPPGLGELKDDELVAVTVPPCHNGVEDDDGNTQVLIRANNSNYGRLIIKTIDPTPRPTDSSYRISETSGMGKGMFATRSLAMGDLIASERPLLIAPILIRQSDASESEKSAQMSLGCIFERMVKDLVNRMSPGRQDAFQQLSNSHSEDNTHPFTGIIRTNGMEVDLSNKNVQYDNETGSEVTDSYVGICNDISRCNHSCAPNAYFVFDLKTFSFQIKAMRSIKRDEEINISYTYVADTCLERLKDLASYNFKCQCLRCSNPEQSDANLNRILGHGKLLPDIMDEWRSNATSTQNMAYDLHHNLFQLMEDEGLQSLMEYKSVIRAIYIICVECGDEAGTMRWGSVLIDRMRAEIPVNREHFIPHFNDPAVFKLYSSWNCRKIHKDAVSYLDVL